MISPARKSSRRAPMTVDAKTNRAFSFCLMIASRPVMKANIPAAIPASMVSAKAGLAPISAQIVSPAGIDLYNEFVSEAPIIYSIGMATISPVDHLPKVVLGTILQDRFFIFISFCPF